MENLAWVAETQGNQWIPWGPGGLSRAGGNGVGRMEKLIEVRRINMY